MEMKDLLNILACPACHGDLELLEKNGEPSAFFCGRCDLAYPIENDIPVMLVSKAISFSDWEKRES